MKYSVIFFIGAGLLAVIYAVPESEPKSQVNPLVQLGGIPIHTNGGEHDLAAEDLSTRDKGYQKKFISNQYHHGYGHHHRPYYGGWNYGYRPYYGGNWNWGFGGNHYGNGWGWGHGWGNGWGYHG